MAQLKMSEIILTGRKTPIKKKKIESESAFFFSLPAFSAKKIPIMHVALRFRSILTCLPILYSPDISCLLLLND